MTKTRESAVVLDDIAERHRTASAQSRDAKLAIGALIHEYIVARFREAIGLSEHHRIVSGFQRSAMIQAVAVRLKIDTGRVHDYLRAHVVVKLLAADGGVGRLSFSAIRQFRRVIERTGRVADIRAVGSDPTVLENWVVSPGCPWAREVFDRARRHNWEERQVRTELDRRLPRSEPSVRLPSADPTVPQARLIAARALPDDAKPVDEAISELEQLQNRFGHLPELRDVFAAFSRLTPRFRLTG
jgi:hypothetical protein